MLHSFPAVLSAGVLALLQLLPAIAAEPPALTVGAIAQASCDASIPSVNPWRLPEPVFLNTTEYSIYLNYYDGVILAGSAESVQQFLDCYDLTVRYEPTYASARGPLWAACSEISAAGLTDIVCVAVNSAGDAADDRIFSKPYAEQVAGAVFNVSEEY